MKRKGFAGIFIVFFTLVLVCMVLQPVVQATDSDSISSRPMIPVEQQIPSKPPAIFVISEEIKHASPYWYQLAADTEGQQTTFNDLSESPISADEKTRLFEGLQAIWTKYPVIIIKTNEGSYLNFTTPGEVTLTDEENRILARVVEIRSEYQSAKYRNVTIDGMATLPPATAKIPLSAVPFLVAASIAALTEARGAKNKG